MSDDLAMSLMPLVMLLPVAEGSSRVKKMPPLRAITPAPLPQPDGMFTQVRFACGPGRTRVGGVCVARTTIRHTRRAVRRGYY
jgi:hypothetical protein